MGKAKLKSIPSGAIKIDGLKSAIEALQGVDEPDRLRILTDIAKKDPLVAEKLKDGLFVFTDIQYFLQSDFQIIWWEIPKATWLLALRKSNPGVMRMVEKFLSKRAFAQLEEDLKNLGPQSVKKILIAQKDIIDQIRSLASAGKIAMPAAKKNDPMI